MKNRIKIILGFIIVMLGLVSLIFFFNGSFDNLTLSYFKTKKEINTSFKPVILPQKVKTIIKEVDREENINIKVYKNVSPGVVNITNKILHYDVFFKPLWDEGAGSGSVLDKKGHILTNYHVIKDAYRLEVTLSNKQKYSAKIIGKDKEFDLAIIKINAPPDILYPIHFADSKHLKVGEKVLAIGNPFGFTKTLTTGIISSLNRTIKMDSGSIISGIIQTDAAINPGNSGGPLLNTSGKLIGVNTMIVSPGKGSVGIGFAIPSEIVKHVIKDLIKYGSRPKLGIMGFSLSRFPGLSQYLKMPMENGVMVVKVQKGLSASLSGIKGAYDFLNARSLNIRIPVGGDIIIKVGDKNIKHPNDIAMALRSKKFGDQVEVVIYRNQKVKTILVKLIPPEG